MIVGVVVGVLSLIAVVVGLLINWRRKNKRAVKRLRRGQKEEEEGCAIGQEEEDCAVRQEEYK